MSFSEANRATRSHLPDSRSTEPPRLHRPLVGSSARNDEAFYAEIHAIRMTTKKVSLIGTGMTIIALLLCLPALYRGPDYSRTFSNYVLVIMSGIVCLVLLCRALLHAYHRRLLHNQANSAFQHIENELASTSAGSTNSSVVNHAMSQNGYTCIVLRSGNPCLPPSMKLPTYQEALERPRRPGTSEGEDGGKWEALPPSYDSCHFPASTTTTAPIDQYTPSPLLAAPPAFDNTTSPVDDGIVESPPVYRSTLSLQDPELAVRNGPDVESCCPDSSPNVTSSPASILVNCPLIDHNEEVAAVEPTESAEVPPSTAAATSVDEKEPTDSGSDTTAPPIQ